jgi:uncharacterized membrane protein
MLKKLLTIAMLTAGGMALKSKVQKTSGSGGRMSTATDSIEVNVPISTAYNQWTQFEEFPKFMAGVLQVRQLDDTHLHWRARIAGKEEQWQAEITEQIPDKLIAWRSTSGARNEGMVTFHRISDSRTEIKLRIDYEPHGVVETVGDALGVVNMRASGNLQRFKAFLEHRGMETGAWRGAVAEK